MDFFARRAFASVIAVAAIAVPVAGCGGGESGDSGDSPLDNALGYVPKDAPFVVSIETDPNGSQFKNAKRIVDKFPFASQVERSLEDSLDDEDLNYERDIKPLLGNQFVVAAPDVRSFMDSSDSESDRVVGAIQVKDKEKLTEAIERQKDKPKEIGEKDGAKLYQSSDSFTAIDDDVLVVADSRRDLEAALDRRGSDDRFTEDDFKDGTKDLPEDSAIRAYFDLQRLIAADPDTRDARKVKWVSALRDFGVSTSVGSDRLDFNFSMSTEGDLSDSDLPLAAGDESPKVIDRPGQAGFGLRGLNQIVKFGEDAAQASNPSDFGSYETAKRTLERQLKLDLQEDVLDQLRGDISFGASSGAQGALVAELEDPDEFEQTLAKLARILPAAARGASGGAQVRVRKSGDLYSVSGAPSARATFGVVDDKFVLAQTPAQARQAASAPTTTVEGAEGAIAMQADAQQLVSQSVAQIARAFQGGSGLGGGGALGQLLGAQAFAGPLGDLTGSVKADTDGVSGKVSLGFD